MKLSIILPTYNEVENIKILIPEIKKEFPNSEIIVIDDKSPDGTAEAAKKLGVRVIIREKREGLGAAIAQGFNSATGDIRISMDADCSISIKDIHRLLEKLKGYDYVVGSKYSKGSQAQGFGSKIQKIVSVFGNIVIRNIYRVPVDDVTLNFKAFRKEILKVFSFKEKTHVIHLEMLLNARSKNLKIGQVPIIFSKRHYGKSKTSLRQLIPLYMLFCYKHFFKIN